MLFLEINCPERGQFYVNTIYVGSVATDPVNSNHAILQLVSGDSFVVEMPAGDYIGDLIRTMSSYRPGYGGIIKLNRVVT